MTDYVIGDIQGCYDQLREVMTKVDFSPSRDRLWIAGDLINRGPSSLKSLRYIESLGSSSVVVLGNHDLHLLAIASGSHSPKKKDTLGAILDAPDRNYLLNWLQQQNLCVHDADRNFVMVHAGVPHIWSVGEAVSYAREVEAVLRGSDSGEYFEQMYGNQPDRWSDSLQGMDRMRVITNYFTRMRFIDENGALEFKAKESPEHAPQGFRPWFDFQRKDNVRVLFGHWASLEGKTHSDRFVGLDTGCVWGGKLTMMNLDSGEKISCDCS